MSANSILAAEQDAYAEAQYRNEMEARAEEEARAAEAEEEEARRQSESDEFIVDPITGEVLGLTSRPPEFTVTNQEEADWVLQKIGENESEIIAVDGVAAVVHARAIVANAEAKKKPFVKKKEFLELRFKPQCHVVASEALEGKKGQTLQLTHGKIALRKVRGTLGFKPYVDPLLWAKAHCTECIKVEETAQISNVPASITMCVEALFRQARAKAWHDAAESDVQMYKGTVSEAAARLALAKAGVAVLEADKRVTDLKTEYPMAMTVAEMPETLSVFELGQDRETCTLTTGVEKPGTEKPAKPPKKAAADQPTEEEGSTGVPLP